MPCPLHTVAAAQDSITAKSVRWELLQYSCSPMGLVRNSATRGPLVASRVLMPEGLQSSALVRYTHCGELEGSVRDADAVEDLTDKLKSGNFSEAITAAQKANEATEQQLCLQAGGGVKRGDPLTAFAQMQEQDPEDELKRIREARKAQMKSEETWKKQGHGSLRHLQDEKEFVEIVAPHERGLLLLDDGLSPAGEECKKALDRLAPRHLEAQFCWLHADRAVFLMHMVKLEGLPAMFVLNRGEVTRHLPPALLFRYSSASSPLFAGHLSKLLHQVGVIFNADDFGEDSDDGSDQDGEHEKERARGYRR